MSFLSRTPIPVAFLWAFILGSIVCVGAFETIPHWVK